MMPTVWYKYINKQEQLTAVKRLRKTTTKTYFANNVQNQVITKETESVTKKENKQLYLLAEFKLFTFPEI